MYIGSPYKTPDLSEPQYNTPLPKVYTHMISYSFPNVCLRRAFRRRLQAMVRSSLVSCPQSFDVFRWRGSQIGDNWDTAQSCTSYTTTRQAARRIFPRAQ